MSREGGARFGRAAANIDRLDSLGTATGGFRPGSILGLDTTNAASGTFSYANPIANPNGGANRLGLAKLGARSSFPALLLGASDSCRFCERQAGRRGVGSLLTGPARPCTGPFQEEFRDYLTCGLLCFGFARAVCTRCPQRFVVAFSCKRRGVCPSCNGRHMAQTAAHLVDHVLPPVPVRQWVISVPKRLRGFLGDRPKVVAAVTRIFLAEIEKLLAWENSGFSIDATVRITLLDRDVPSYFQSLEHLLRYCARPPFALHRLSVIRDADGRIARIRYVMPRHKAATWVGPGRKRKSTQPGAGGVTELSPFVFLDRLADLIPQPRRHRHRYHGVFAPNHPLRPAVTALAVGSARCAAATSGSSPSSPSPVRSERF